MKLWEPSVSPKNAKVHLARFNGVEHPLDVFIAGNFDSWQSWQSAKNFEKEYLVSLVQAGTPTRWLFAGLFKPRGREDVGGELGRYRYSLARVAAAEGWVGRAYLTSTYKQRNSYPLATTLAEDLRIVELLPERVSIGQFPGYKSVNLTKGQLDLVVRQNIPAWRAALSSVKGIYLISDATTGKLYVGKADGVDGIWGRWRTYSATTHGHNVALKKEFGIEPSPKRWNAVRFSILEIADLQATQKDIDHRESHWKHVLMTRQHGFNLN